MKAISAPLLIGSLRSSKAGTPLPSFDYHPLGRVVFEVGGLNRLGVLARDLGGKRILLVTDPGLETAGHPQRATQSLHEAGLDIFLFDEVEENPTTRHVDA